MKKGIKSMLLTGVVAASLLTSGCNLFSDEGVKWYTGESAPTSETGVDGDFYFDLTTNKTYYKQDGEWKEKAVSNTTKDISKIEKVSTGNDTTTYKITYADGSTETFEVDKDADLIDYTQEELFEEFKTIAANSMAKPYYSAVYRDECEGDEECDTYSYMTTDENGYYDFAKYEGGEDYATYYFKSEDKYVKYRSQAGSTPTYITQEQWQAKKKNYIQFLNEDADEYSMYGLFTSQTIDEVISHIRLNWSARGNITELTGKITKQFDEQLNKEKLLLKIKVGVTNLDQLYGLEYIIECYSNEIKSIIMNYKLTSLSGELNLEGTISFAFEYFTNTALVPSTDRLESCLPTE